MIASLRSHRFNRAFASVLMVVVVTLAKSDSVGALSGPTKTQLKAELITPKELGDGWTRGNVRYLRHTNVFLGVECGTPRAMGKTISAHLESFKSGMSFYESLGSLGSLRTAKKGFVALKKAVLSGCLAKQASKLAEKAGLKITAADRELLVRVANLTNQNEVVQEAQVEFHPTRRHVAFCYIQVGDIVATINYDGSGTGDEVIKQALLKLK